MNLRVALDARALDLPSSSDLRVKASAAASGMTTTCPGERFSAATRSRATASLGTITRAARSTARYLSVKRSPLRRYSPRRLSGTASWRVTTIGTGQRSIAPSIQGAW